MDTNKLIGILRDYRLNDAAYRSVCAEMETVALRYQELREQGKPHDAPELQRLLARQRELSSKRRYAHLATQRVRCALEGLDEPERELLVQAYCEGKSPLDVMEHLAVEKSNYYRLRHRALHRFAYAYACGDAIF